MRRGIVVIPTYNEVENLPLLVPRVLEQDPRLEVLIVDDDSPDGTGKLADELSDQDVLAMIAYFQSKWPDEIYQAWHDRNMQ